jgi:hypothetical protein
MPDSPTFQHLKRDYTLHVHTAGYEKGYTLYVSSTGSGNDTPCMSNGNVYTLHVHTDGGGKRYTLHAHSACFRNVYTLHVHTAGGGKEYICTSIVLAVEMDTPCTSILLVLVDSLSRSKLKVVNSDTSCTSIDSC